MIARIKKFIDDYWYYYKWYVIGGLFLLFALIVAITGTVTQEKYDTSVIWAMRGYVEQPYLDAMEEELEKYCDDLDGNGEVNVRVILITYTSDGGMLNGDVELSMQQKLVTQLSVGEVYMVIADEISYEGYMTKLGAFEDLDDDYPENEKIDGYKYYLKDTVFTQNELLKQVVGEDTFMLMGSDELQKLNQKDQEQHKYMREMFDRIVKAG